MNYCKYLRKRKNKPFCKLENKEITFHQCKGCINKEYKSNTSRINKNAQSFVKTPIKKTKMHNKSKKLKSIKKETSKHRKNDKNRFSIIVDDLSKCCVCGSSNEIAKHEVFYGAYRHLSIKYGLVIPLCPFHHTIGKFAIHNDRDLDLYYKRLGQDVFEEKYSHELFMRVFKIDYKKREEKDN